MKRLTTTSVVCAFVALFAAAGYSQQPGLTNYRTAQLLRVPADKEAAYLEFLRTNTRRVYQLRMQDGGVLSWAVLKLAFEGSPALEYNYVATTLHAGPPADPSLEEQDQLFRRAAGISYAEYQQKLLGLRTSVGSVLSLVEAAVPGMQMREGNYLGLSRWKIEPLQGSAYADYIQTTVLPLQLQNFKDGHHLGWTATRTMYPGGGDAPFDATTATIYRDLASALKIQSPQEAAARFARAHPDGSYVAFVDRGRAVRRQVRTELFKVMIAEDASQLTTSAPGQRTPAGGVAGTR